MNQDGNRAAARSRVPRGVQPEQNGRIQCLECGGWYQGLGNHLRLSHEMDVDQYKQEHGLPASRGLVPEQLRETMRGNQRRRLEIEPGLREALTNDEQTLRARLRTGREVARTTRSRAGVQHYLRESARRSGLKRSQDIRAAKDATARALGYADLRDLLQQTAHLTARQVGPMIGESAVQVRKWRGKYDVVSTSLEHRVDQRRAEREDGLALTPPGVQPAADGRLRCLDCGRWYGSLASHVAVHGLNAGSYRQRHGLAADVSLVAEQIRQRIGRPRGSTARAGASAPDRMTRGGRPDTSDEHGSATAQPASARAAQLAGMRHLAARARVEQARGRHDGRAQELGYRDLAAFLTATAHLPRQDAAKIFGVSSAQLVRIRAGLETGS